ncbi:MULTISPECIES: nucleoside diphosphate kinase regulator [Rufibacter]|uniref:Regulator of nucleoside diphosphate kinase n=1 Tax=Rufibacter quisquiliarum TaxID=1549639 RepID=A0A839GM64_9BACT|nr:MULTISPECIES: nucleoside diphosphate kinase regulator [Rufibacter]MBA9076027.1 regulator of nucleoside diphosphate kinase [Rufibacter quisquiliarum]
MNVIYLTEKDHERLHQLVQHQRTVGAPQTVENLCQTLRLAHLIPSEEVPEDVVTMNSLVRLKEKKSGTVMELTLVYPKDADMNARKISVLAPVGAAILGKKVNQEVECAVASRTLAYRVEEVIYQPEAAGDFFL